MKISRCAQTVVLLCLGMAGHAIAADCVKEGLHKSALDVLDGLTR